MIRLSHTYCVNLLGGLISWKYKFCFEDERQYFAKTLSFLIPNFHTYWSMIWCIANYIFNSWERENGSKNILLRKKEISFVCQIDAWYTLHSITHIYIDISTSHFNLRWGVFTPLNTLLYVLGTNTKLHFLNFLTPIQSYLRKG